MGLRSMMDLVCLLVKTGSKSRKRFLVIVIVEPLGL